MLLGHNNFMFLNSDIEFIRKIQIIIDNQLVEEGRVVWSFEQFMGSVYQYILNKFHDCTKHNFVIMSDVSKFL